MIRVGTAGWHYLDWNGVVYPRHRPRGFDPLETLVMIFDTVEVNVSFYRIPPPSMVESWLKRSAFNERFRFTMKLPRTFTHERSEELEEEEHLFRDAIAPLAGSDRLGAVLVQFPQSFHSTPESTSYLEGLLERFSDLPLVVEFRHAGWGNEETAELLRSRGIGFCNIDQPRLGSTLRPTKLVTGSVAYVRLHGRNAAEWFRERNRRDRRYDYLYSQEELAPWLDSIRRIAESGADTYVITNNHFRGKAVVNALQIRAALEGGLVEVPDPLLTAYPELASIAKQSGGRLPF